MFYWLQWIMANPVSSESKKVIGISLSRRMSGKGNSSWMDLNSEAES